MIEIREPKFKAGERVIDKNGDVSTVINVNHYYFDKDEYWYNTEKDETIRLKPESNLESYQENPKTVWDLEKGDTFYVIDSDGDAIKKVDLNTGKTIAIYNGLREAERKT